MSFANLKRNSANDLAKLNEVAKKQSGTGEKDERYWNISVDKDGNGSAVIRFLPAGEGEDIPWVRWWDHSFKGPGGWYIAKDRCTLNEDDPCSLYNNKLWNSVTDAEDPKNQSPARKQVSAQKRKLNYVANIYVVKDAANPSNEGKVFLFRFGKKIYDKIQAKMNPPEDDIAPINPFNFWEGANFRLRARKVDGQRNYDSSEWDEKSALLGGDDDKLEEVYKKIYPLTPLIAPETFQSYADLEKRLLHVLGLKSLGLDEENTKKKIVPEDDDSPPKAEKPKQEKAKPAPEPESKEEEDTVDSKDEDEDDVGIGFFQNLADEED